MFCITFYAYIMLWKTWRIVYMYLDLYFYLIKEPVAKKLEV